MKWKVILEVEVKADPGDFGAAARKGFKAIAKIINSEEPVKVKLLPLDGGSEAELYNSIMASCLGANATLTIK